MSDKVRLGIIGLGNMGSGHAKNIMEGKCPEIEIAAVADVNPARLEWAKENLPAGVKLFATEKELMESGAVDAVHICTPHYFHPPYAIEAMRLGLNVMCEKPAGVYTKQVREMNDVAKQCDVVFGMMFNQRTNPIYRKMRELIASGEFGAVKRTNWLITDWYRTQAYYDSGAWRATWAGEGGGVLLNQCPHNLDLMQWISGMPSKVQAFAHNGKWHDIEVEDDVTAYFEYPNGATGVFITSTGDAPGTNRFEVLLEGGKIVNDGGVLTVTKLAENEREWCKTCENGFKAPPREVIDVELEAGGGNGHVGVLNAFADAILHGGQLIAPGLEGINGLSLSNAMHLSSWLGKPVDIPVDEELFLSELNKRRASSRHKESSGVVFGLDNSYGGQ